jgi:hypothetical protein
VLAARTVCCATIVAEIEEAGIGHREWFLTGGLAQRAYTILPLASGKNGHGLLSQACSNCMALICAAFLKVADALLVLPNGNPKVSKEF